MNENQLRTSLMGKGWSKEEVDHTFHIMKKGEEQKYSQLINKAMYWISLIVAIIGNLMVSLMMIPILMALPGAALYFTIAVIAGTFGVLLNFLVEEIESAQQKRLIVSWLFLPLLAAVNVLFIVIMSNDFSALLGFLQHNPIAISIVYVVPFTMPYIISAYKKDKQRFIVKEPKQEYIPKLYGFE